MMRENVAKVSLPYNNLIKFIILLSIVFWGFFIFSPPGNAQVPPFPSDPNAPNEAPPPEMIESVSPSYATQGDMQVAIGATTTDQIITDIPAVDPGGLYDESILRTIYLEFPQADWWQQLGANYETEVNILADLTMDGVTYPDVGIRFKGMTSYMMTGNSQKKSFNIEMDETYPDQTLMGYKTLNLNNASQDPSFIREVLYFHIFRKYAPCPQANFVKLVINGEDWGIYVNAQQNNSDLIKEWFKNNDGDRWKVSMGNGFGGGFFFDGNAPQFSFDDWLSSPMAQDLNQDGQVNEDDYTIFMDNVQNGPPGGGWMGDPNMTPPPGGGIFPPLPISFEDWLSSPMAQDLNNDGQITEDDYTIFSSSSPPPGGGWMGDPNMTLPPGGGWMGDPNMTLPPGGGWMGDPNMTLPPGGGMMGGGDGALTWLGSDVAPYEQAYELKSTHTDDPWVHLITACDILNNTPLDQLAYSVDSVLAVDRWLWFLALENIFTDEDSYLTKGWDYQIYYDPETGQIHPLEHDGNEVFITNFVNQSLFEGESYPTRPVISRLLFVPQFRERYLAHIRTIIEESLNWDLLAPQIMSYRALITDGVMADTKKLYSNEQFEASFSDIQNFINGRRDYLLNQPEINKPVPHVSSVMRQVDQAGDNSVWSGQPVWIIATVQCGSHIEQGILYYTAGQGPFEQVAMFWAEVNGNSDGNDVLVAEIPPFPAGSLVRYYVEVRTAEAGEGNSLAPYKAEDYIFAYRISAPVADSTPIVINELMAQNRTTIQDPQGEYEDWIELLNTSDHEIDLSGMYLSDDEDNPRKWQIPEGTTLASGAYLIIWADEDGSDAPGLHANFKLSAEGEMVLLTDTDEQGNALLDSVAWAEQETDISLGRFPDGTGQFLVLSEPTPNEENLSLDSDNDGDGYIDNKETHQGSKASQQNLFGFSFNNQFNSPYGYGYVMNNWPSPQTWLGIDWPDQVFPQYGSGSGLTYQNQVFPQYGSWSGYQNQVFAQYRYGSGYQSQVSSPYGYGLTNQNWYSQPTWYGIKVPNQFSPQSGYEFTSPDWSSPQAGLGMDWSSQVFPQYGSGISYQGLYSPQTWSWYGFYQQGMNY